MEAAAERARAELEATFAASGIATERLRPHFGLAFAPGTIDLSQPLPAAVDDALTASFYAFGILVFRELWPEPEQELEFARRFSHDPAQRQDVDRNYGKQLVPGQPKLPAHPSVALVGGAEVVAPGHYVGTVDANDQPPGGMRRSWHCDGVVDEYPPPECTAMRAVRSPADGGDTLFVHSSHAARLAMEAAADEGWDGPALERAVCHYRPSVVTALWHELEVTDSGISLCPMGDATLAAFAAEPTAANTLQAMVRGDGYRPKGRQSREYAFPLLTLARLAEGVTAPTMIHQCRALHAVSDGVTGEALSFADSQRYAQPDRLCSPLADEPEACPQGCVALGRYMERVWAPGLAAAQNTYSHSWAEGDFVVWNNRIIMHSATSKGLWKRGEGDERLLHRIRMR